jgi:hypothetical protein
MVSLVAGGFAVGSMVEPASATTNTTAQPVRQIVTTSLSSAAIANNGTIYGADGSDIDVMAPSSDGPPVVTKTFTGAGVSSTMALREGTGLAYASGSSVQVIDPAQASGAVVPVRTISGASTKLDSPGGVAWTSSGSLWVSDVDPATSRVELLRFAPGANGNVAPVQVISGARTHLDTDGIALGGALITVAGLPHNGVAAAAASVEPTVSVFRGSQSGNAAPVRRLRMKVPSPHWLTEGVGTDSAGNIYIGAGDVDGRYFGRLDVFGPTGSTPRVSLGGFAQGFQIPLLPVVAANGTMALLDATILNVSGSSTAIGKIKVFKPLFAKPGKVRSLKVTKTKKSRKVSWAAPSFRGNTAAPLTYRVVVKKGAKTKFSRTVKGTRLTIARKALPMHKRLKVTVTAVNVGGSGAGVSKEFKN